MSKFAIKSAFAAVLAAMVAGRADFASAVEVSVVAGATPTQTTGVKGEATAYSWGETYKLTDNAKDYTIVKVTKAGESVAVTVPAETPIEMLVVGGGGAGSDYTGNRGAGGGAGGLVWKSVIFAEETELTLTVGAGGTASGANGTDSTVAAGGELLVQAFGGGGGGTANVGGAGGSGGGGVNKGAGGSALNSGGDLATGIGVFGYAGGNAGTGTAPGGGGGAGGAGSNGTSNSPGGDGGPGLVYAITGVKEGYAGGGGGAPNSNGGAVTIDDVVITLGGYGYSSAHNDKASHNAQVANSGSGGGGASGGNFGDGADGIIVLRYIPPVDTRTPVDKPEISGARFAYDGADHKPVITPEEGWTVSYSAAEWVAIGTYAVTITLEKGYKWSDNTTAPLVIAYTVYDPNAVVRVAGEPTTTLGVVYQPSLTMTDWGYRYTLVDRETADAFTVIVVTNARQNVSWDIPALATVETLVVGGGGAGGEVNNSYRARGGGGGAGGLVWGKYFYPTAKTVTLRVGAGGSVAGESGGDSTMEISGVPLITAHGGGGGANGSIAAKSGGSGGGGAPSPSVAAGAAEGGHPGEYANAGGNANGTNAAGGGGGAGNAANGVNGGEGLGYAITGENRGYAAGGGGSPGGAGGLAAQAAIGGYGYGGLGNDSAATAGAANTGSGGGGAGAGQAAGTGASGVIVLRYANVNQKFELKENAQGELEAIPVPGLIFYLFR